MERKSNSDYYNSVTNPFPPIARRSEGERRLRQDVHVHCEKRLYEINKQLKVVNAKINNEFEGGKLDGLEATRQRLESERVWITGLQNKMV